MLITKQFWFPLTSTVFLANIILQISSTEECHTGLNYPFKSTYNNCCYKVGDGECQQLSPCISDKEINFKVYFPGCMKIRVGHILFWDGK